MKACIKKWLSITIAASMLLVLLPTAALATDVNAADALADAFAAGGSIKLTESFSVSETLTVTKDKTVTLDLNGQTLTSTAAPEATDYAIRIDGSLTLLDSSEDKTGKITTAGLGKLILVADGATLNIQSGTYESTSTDSHAQATIQNSGTLLMTGGTVSAAYHAAIFNAASSQASAVKCTIQGGTASGGWYGVGIFGPGLDDNGNVNNDAVQVTLENGTITTKIGDGQGIATNASSGKYAGFTFTMTGGTIDVVTDNDTESCGLYLPAIGKTIIKGGTIKATCQGIRIAAGELYIEGGTILVNKARNEASDIFPAGASGGAAGALAIGKAGSGYTGDLIVKVTGGTLENTAAEADAILMSDANMASSEYENNSMSIQIAGGAVKGDVIRKSGNTEADGGNTAFAISGDKTTVTGKVTNESNTGSIAISGGATVTGDVLNTGTGSISVIESTVTGSVSNTNEQGSLSIIGSEVGSISNSGSGTGSENKSPVVTNQRTGEVFNTLADAVSAAASNDTLLLGEGTYTSEGITTDKSLTIRGQGSDKTIIKRTGKGFVLQAIYKDGVHFTLDGVTIDGNNSAGAFCWTMDESYKDTATPADMPTLDVTNCVFTNTDAANPGGAGIGLWDSKPYNNAAASVVTIDSCTFTNMGAGIYYSEESPLLNLQSTVKDSTFENLTWTGTAGLPANADIYGNTFAASCSQAIQYLFNANQTSTNTKIHDNVIDSKVGIQLMPYHLNENNNTDTSVQTVQITADMVPEITMNVRHTDSNLVTLVAYRSGTDETAVFNEGAIDLNRNYTDGEAPTVAVTVQDASEGKTAPEIADVTPEIKNDEYYLADTMEDEDLNTYEPTYYTITASAGTGGKISPRTAEVEEGGSQSFTIRANSGYKIDDVKVDGRSVGRVTSYTFEDVTEDHSIRATFRSTGNNNNSSNGGGTTITFPGSTKNPFQDVSQGSWYYDSVKYVYDAGLFAGTEPGIFSPDNGMTRGMLVTVLHRMAGQPRGTVSTFADVESGAWFTPAVAWASANAIVTGYDAATFGPNDFITREQMAAILYRYARYKNFQLTGSADIMAYRDGADVSDWAQEAMSWAIGRGIISGRDDGSLDPKGTATRAEVAAIMMRFQQGA